MTAPNGTKSESAYNALERLTGVANKTSTNAILSQYGYTIDNAKNIRTAMSEVQGSNPQRSVSYGYDTVNQLTGESSVEATLPNASTRSNGIAYDAMGNRQNQSLVQSVNGGAASTTSVLYTHNKLNQMTGLNQSTTGGAATLTALSYDASGNMTAQAQNNGGSTYTYDDADRLISLVQKDVTTGVFTKKSEYVYDGSSRKAISREYSWDATLNNNAGGWTLNEEKRRVYDGMDVVQERDGSNTTTVNYTRSGNIGGLLARSDSTGNYFFDYDGSGNVVGLTNASQQVVAEYAYDAWGNTLRATGGMASVNAYRYSTKELQASNGLYDYGFRFYSPGLGRWINRDPIEEDGGLNVYGFVGNDAVNSVDDYGLRGCRES